MRSTMLRYGVAAAAFFCTFSLFAAPCNPSSTRLCLTQSRFQVEVSWRDFGNNVGSGQAMPVTADTGYFWFFDSANVELIVKVLDARIVNGKFWVFFGALSNVEYTLRVTDTVSGAVKTYFNPSGQFASVGDTSAFSADGSVTSAFVVVEGSIASTPMGTHSSPMTQALSTCVAFETSLCLNGGRFRVEVNWKDFEGNTGVGNAVSLTPDTGYFWFFNDANVELVVKVLDARTINQKFWVFYGALSNVEYEMTVTDTLTGNVITYVNPSERFASTGDTSAFPAGHAVAVRLDETRAVTADVPVEGGTMSATASDGTTFTLTIPKDALLSEERITMTPVAAIDGLPLSRGLAGAVDLQPGGLRLFDLATLTIAPPQAISLAEEITFAWRGNGEEFFLYPPELGTPTISVKLMHFGGYGVGRGTAEDELAQRQRVPASPEDELHQRLQELVANQRRAESTRVGALAENPVLNLLLSYHDRLKFDLEFAKKSCPAAKVVLPRALTWTKEAARFNCCPEQISAIKSASIDAVVNCYNESFDKCVSQRNPLYALDLARYFRELKVLSSDDRVDRSKHERCLRFELRFDSSASFPAPPTYSHDVVAAVPIRWTGSVFTGSTTFYTAKAEWLGPTSPQCSFSAKSNDSVFDVKKLTLNVNQIEGAGWASDPVKMVYKPGSDFDFVVTMTCPQNTQDLKFPGGWWWPHHQNHQGEMVGDREYETRFWQLIGRRSVLARKVYNLTSPVRENTVMELKHTPDQ